MNVFIDSNLPMYAAGRDHPYRDPARRFLERVREGNVDACTSTEVVQEILYRYSALRRRDLAREVYEIFVEICPVVLSVTLADTDRACNLLCEGAALSARDALHAAVMLSNNVEWIATFDTDFDRVKSVRRMKLA